MFSERVFASEAIALYFAGSQVRGGCPGRLACTCRQQPAQAVAAAVAGGDLWPAAAGPILRLWSAGVQAVMDKQREDSVHIHVYGTRSKFNLILKARLGSTTEEIRAYVQLRAVDARAYDTMRTKNEEN